MAKIEMKINRYIKHIGENDVILDNSACIQVTTQQGSWGGWGFAPLTMSKKMFRQLKTCGFIFVDKEKTDKARRKFPFVTYYRFDIDRMIKNGYPIVEEQG